MSERSSISPICLVHRLGIIPYQQAWDLQESLADQIARGERSQTLLLLEHPHIFTFGRRSRTSRRSLTSPGEAAENLLWDEQELDRRGVQTLWVDRGGDVTYHGPGQLVGYPLLHLSPGGLFAGTNHPPESSSQNNLPKADYIGYLRKLEQTLIQALAHFGLDCFQLGGKTGVWVKQTFTPATQSPPDAGDPSGLKIASIGVKVDARGISRHGFALNVDPDMSYWEGIVACGLAGYSAVSLAELIQPTPTMKAVEDAVIQSFREVFGFAMVEAQLDPEQPTRTSFGGIEP